MEIKVAEINVNKNWRDLNSREFLKFALISWSVLNFL